MTLITAIQPQGHLHNYALSQKSNKFDISLKRDQVRLTAAAEFWLRSQTGRRITRDKGAILSFLSLSVGCKMYLLSPLSETTGCPCLVFFWSRGESLLRTHDVCPSLIRRSVNSMKQHLNSQARWVPDSITTLCSKCPFACHKYAKHSLQSSLTFLFKSQHQPLIHSVTSTETGLVGAGEKKLGHNVL